MMTEQEVLQALDIPDFRHLTKDKAISLVSMVSEMEPEVAKKALEQYPEFAKTMVELATDYKATIEQGLAGNNESTKACYDICNTIIEALKGQIDRDDLSFEEKKYYVDKLMEVAQIVQQKDSENKSFIISMVKMATIALSVIGTAACVALGTNVNIKLPKAKH